MDTNFRPRPRHIEAPVDPRRPLIPSGLADSSLFPGWGPRV